MMPYGPFGITPPDKKLAMMTGASLAKDFESLSEPPLFLDPITAYRSWFVVEHPKRGLILRSITHRVAWPLRKPMIAHCMTQLRGERHGHTPHSAPHLKHQCGIYAVKNRDHAKNWSGSSIAGSGIAAVGGVRLWGNVLQFTDGFLAEYAYPTWLTLKASSCENYDPSEVASEIQERYGIKVLAEDWE